MTTCGRICFKGCKVNLSRVFVGQQVGVRQVSERVWLVTFMYYDLGYFEDETCRPRADRKPVWSNRVTHVSGIIRYPCLRNGPSESGRGDWIRTSDPLRPRQVRYQAALRPDLKRSIIPQPA